MARYKKISRKPVRRYRPHKYTKRMSFKRRVYKAPKLGIGRAVFPDRLRTKLFFDMSNVQMVSTTGSLVRHTYRLNSLYRPEDTTGGTHGPRFADTLFGPTDGSAPYTSYKVYGAKVIIKFYSDGSACSHVAMGARDGNVNTFPASIRECNERSFYKTKIFGSNTGGPSVVVMSRYFDLSKVAQVTRRQYMDDDDYTGTWTTNPNEVMNLDIFAEATPAQTRTVFYDMQIIFYTQCRYGNDVSDS